MYVSVYVYRIDRQNDVIQQSLRRVAEIQEDGQNISIMLAQNRETLDTIHNKVCINLDLYPSIIYDILTHIYMCCIYLCMYIEHRVSRYNYRVSTSS